MNRELVTYSRLPSRLQSIPLCFSIASEAGILPTRAEQQTTSSRHYRRLCTYDMYKGTLTRATHPRKGVGGGGGGVGGGGGGLANRWPFAPERHQGACSGNNPCRRIQCNYLQTGSSAVQNGLGSASSSGSTVGMTNCHFQCSKGLNKHFTAVRCEASHLSCSIWGPPSSWCPCTLGSSGKLGVSSGMPPSTCKQCRLPQISVRLKTLIAASVEHEDVMQHIWSRSMLPAILGLCCTVPWQ